METTAPHSGIKTSARRPRRAPADIRARILYAAADEFKTRGLASATTAAIARRADVTEAQLFRYFASKADLFCEAVVKPLDQHFADFNALMLAGADQSGSYAQDTARYIHELQRFIGEQSSLLLSLIVAQTYAANGQEREEPVTGLKDYFDRGAAAMAGRVGAGAAVEPQLMVRVSFAAVLGTVLFKDWMFPAGLASDQEIDAAITSFVMDGINANPS